MPLYDPEDDEFEALCARHAWVEAVLLAECGEIETPEGADEIPESLNWLALLPGDARFEIEEVECNLVYRAGDGHLISVWEATGEDDIPWATLIVDDAGVRLLDEYSVLDTEATEETLDKTLERASVELPERLRDGALSRNLPAIPVPDWLINPQVRE